MAPTQPKPMILNLYGAWGRRLGGWLPIATLVELLGDLGIDEQAARSAVSRMKGRGYLLPERRDGRGGYVLTDQARTVLDEGDRRLFARRELPSLDEGWVMVVFSVPETERQDRHVLRSRLVWQGFGNVAPGVWIAPWRLHEDARRLLARHGLSGYVDLFHGRHEGFRPSAERVAAWWDLDRLGRGYTDFVEDRSRVLDRWVSGFSSDDREAFADYLGTVAAWQRFPYLDPGLPVELLPADWQGQRASELFFALTDLLDGPGERHVAAALHRRSSDRPRSRRSRRGGASRPASR
ncbi:MAG: PaaX family transcriptional regulator [Actinomycetota bacterium]|nr:PaaX family transcriptional regulator [Actinomycetota bacterium]